ncbi:hypothetical protein FJW07_14040 [Mesorhizobium sp. B3-1-9]|uniref:hypothetical protein n=1 Tax=unclassified Mesorhizobium TaxID=325217 RepID=UPI00112CD5FD|nr:MULTISPECIES: hypothetical protein [unclassified Mesorhizobium]TPI39297.1 hypothetical protein FJW07_14040 [Mesorhizobium sp. B3-1-9]UCI23701.1 hypothetical protein FJ430_18980 [Mesorhizobium sp. B2-8-5]
MTDTMLPMLRQLYNADGNQARADILLRIPDSVLLKYRGSIVEACRRASFEVGLAFVDMRTSALLAVRDATGQVPPERAAMVERYRRALVGFVNGGAS